MLQLMKSRHSQRLFRTKKRTFDLAVEVFVRSTAVFKKVATFNIDFVSHDGNRTHQIAFRSCDSNFVHKTIEIERTKNFDSQIELQFFVLRSRWLCRDFISSSNSSKRFSCKKIDCFPFYWHHQSHNLDPVLHKLNAIFERVT